MDAFTTSKGTVLIEGRLKKLNGLVWYRRKATRMVKMKKVMEITFQRIIIYTYNYTNMIYTATKKNK